MWRSGALRLARRLLRADAGIKLRCAGAGLACFAAGGAGLAYAEPKPARSGKSAALQTVSTRTNNIHTDYEFGEGIGAGAYGTIYKGKCKHTGRTVAIKALPRRKETEAMVRAEVTALRRVALHRSIAEIYDFYEAPTVFYIVMEFVDGGPADLGPRAPAPPLRTAPRDPLAADLLQASCSTTSSTWGRFPSARRRASCRRWAVRSRSCTRRVCATATSSRRTCCSPRTGRSARS